MSRRKNEISTENMAPIFGSGSGNGTLRSTTSTVTTPLSCSRFVGNSENQQNASNVINGFDYNKKLNGTLKTDKLKAFRTSSNSGSITKHIRIHKLPQPHRCDSVFKALEDALKECMVVTQQDIDSLRSQLVDTFTSNNHIGPPIEQETPVLATISVEAQKQLKAAERYSKRLAFHASRIDELRDLYELQLSTIPEGEREPLSSVVTKRHKSFSSTSSFKGQLKDLVHILCKLEAELEMLVGTLSVEVKGIAGFARLAPGDVFEVQLKCGAQKWKSKVKIGSDKAQTWDAEAVIFKCLLEDLLEVKVYEHKGFGKSVLLIEKTFDPLHLFRAHPQLITLDLNRNGSLKLSLQSTWNPLDGLLTPLTTASELMNSTSTMNGGGGSKSNSNASSIRGTSKLESSIDQKSIASLDNGSSRRSSLLQNGRTNNCNGIARNGSLVNSALITTPPLRVQNERTQSPLVVANINGSSAPVKQSTNGSHGEPNLAEVLRRLKPVVHCSTSRFPELTTLEDIIFTLDTLLANSTLTLRQNAVQNGRPNSNNRTSVIECYGTLDRLDRMRLRSEDMDDLDNNILNRPSQNGPRVQFTDSLSNGNGNVNGSLLRKRIGEMQLPPPSPTSSASSVFSHDTPSRRRRYLKKGESNGDQQQESQSFRGYPTIFERPRSTIFDYFPTSPTNDDCQITVTCFGLPDLDICLHHHLVHCEMLLQKLVGYGPLHHCEQEALYKLTVETSILAYLTPMAKQPMPMMTMPKITQLLNDLDASTELQDVWLSVSGTGAGGYFLPSAALRHEFLRSYGHIVQSKYEELVPKVFDKIMHLLTDRSTWEPDVISVFQFVYCFHEKQLVIFMESLAHETWIVETINCRVRNKIQRVIERLKHVPVSPPADVLRHIGLVLVDENIELCALAESYLLNAQGSLRADLVAAYLAFLEHDDTDTRRGACRALAILTARRCLSALAFVSHNDRKASVREEARRAVLTFGNEGNAMLKNGDQPRQVIETASVRF